MATKTRKNPAVAWVGDESELARGLKSRYRGASVSFRPPAKARQEWAASLHGYDLVVWAWNKIASGERLRIVREVQTQHPQLPMLVIDIDFDDEGAREIVEGPWTDFVLRPVNLEEVFHRIDRLLSYDRHLLSRRPPQPSWFTSSRGALTEAPAPVRDGSVAPGQGRSFEHVAFDLHNPRSGRLDAKRISDLFGVPVRQIADLLRQKPQTVSKTPDSKTLQAGLTVFERIASALMSLVGSREGLRIWLNAGNPQLDGRTPMELLLEGQGEVVADLLESMLVGQPG